MTAAVRLTAHQQEVLRRASRPDNEGIINTYAVNVNTLNILSAAGLIAQGPRGDVPAAEANALSEVKEALHILSEDLSQWDDAYLILKRARGKLITAQNLVWRITDAGLAAIGGTI